MTSSIPMIRASAMAPMMRWLVQHEKPLEQLLTRADLGNLPFVDPNRAIPLRNAASLFEIAGRELAPDIGCRIASETTLEELAFIGGVILGARSPAEALTRSVAALPYHSSHETISLDRTAKGLVVCEGWSVRFDDLTLHTIQQFFASVIGLICSATRARPPLMRRVEMLPHPDLGFSHLQGWFGLLPEPARDRTIRLTIDTAVADRPFFKVARDRTGGKIPAGVERLSGDVHLARSVKTVLELQLDNGAPSVDRAAFSAGMSRRSFQRQLAAEGTSFASLLDEVRRERALEYLEAGAETLDDLSARLGYARQSTLTRAVRRWTGRTPSAVRQG